MVVFHAWAPTGGGKGGTCLLAPWKCCKVFCASVVTVKTCALRATTKKKSSTFFRKKVHPCENFPPPWKNPAGADGFKRVRATSDDSKILTLYPGRPDSPLSPYNVYTRQSTQSFNTSYCYSKTIDIVLLY